MTDLLVEHFGDYVDVAFTARMEEELDEVARGERAWVPLLEAFYAPLRDLVAEKRKELSAPISRPRRATRSARKATRWSSASDATASSSPARCSPTTRSRDRCPGTSRRPRRAPARSAPSARRARSSAGAAGSGRSSGCSRYPDCDYIKKDGPPPPDPLPFEVICPKNKDGLLVPRRARRTGNVFWGCAKYPKCDFTTNFEPLGGVHDADDGPLARKGEAAICLACGSTSDTGPDDIAPGERYAGGPADASVLARPARAGRGGGGRSGGRRATGRGGAKSNGRAATGATAPAADE